MNVPATLSVEHDTRYDYDAPVDVAQHVAFLRPIEDAYQQVEAFEMSVAPEPLHHGSGRDRYGNHRTFFTVGVAHRELEVRARSRVRVKPRPAAEPGDSLPWEAVRERLRYAAGRPYEAAVEFGMPSSYVPRLAALQALGSASLVPDRPVAEAAIDLMRRIHAGFEYRSASTSVETPLEQVLRQRRGVCQDFAHLMVGALRMHGLAARYVSGYLLTAPPEGEAQGAAPMVGADASHAWVAVWCPRPDDSGNAFWLELDPTNDVLPTTAHVRLAHGRDYGDVTPLRGVIRGGGEHRLSVRVRTRRVE